MFLSFTSDYSVYEQLVLKHDKSPLHQRNSILFFYEVRKRYALKINGKVVHIDLNLD